MNTNFIKNIINKKILFYVLGSGLVVLILTSFVHYQNVLDVDIADVLDADVLDADILDTDILDTDILTLDNEQESEEDELDLQIVELESKSLETQIFEEIVKKLNEIEIIKRELQIKIIELYEEKGVEFTAQIVEPLELLAQETGTEIEQDIDEQGEEQDDDADDTEDDDTEDDDAETEDDDADDEDTESTQSGAGTESSSSSDSESDDSTPTPTPTPTPAPTPDIVNGRCVNPVASGKQTYSGGSRSNPRITQIELDPLDVRIGRTQVVDVEIQDTDENPITEVTAVVQSDNGTDSFSFSLNSGSSTDGSWQGSWSPEDTLCTIYSISISATSASGTSTTDLSFR